MKILPDIEALVRAWLLEHDSVADLVEDRIYADKQPPNPTYPLLRIQRIGGAPRIEGHLDRPVVQIEAWDDLPENGGRKTRVNDVARTVQAALVELRGKHRSEGVVTDLRTDLGPVWIPDPETDQPRYLLSVSITAHP